MSLFHKSFYINFYLGFIPRLDIYSGSKKLALDFRKTDNTDDK